MDESNLRFPVEESKRHISTNLILVLLLEKKITKSEECLYQGCVYRCLDVMTVVGNMGQELWYIKKFKARFWRNNNTFGIIICSERNVKCYFTYLKQTGYCDHVACLCEQQKNNQKVPLWSGRKRRQLP